LIKSPHQNIFNMEKDKEIIIIMKNINKSFYGYKALDNVDFYLRRGEIHVILGENGAGKTTLVKILSGLYSPDSGEIYINGEKVEIKSSKEAVEYGIAMVNQYPQLVEELSVVDNISLSLHNIGVLKSTWRIYDDIVKVSDKYGFRINPKEKISNLSFSERQRVEIIKAILLDANVIIMDEPTTLLTTRERKMIYQFMKKIKNEGKSIILITHKLSEALEVADKITILRKGKVVGRVDGDKATYEELIKLMFSKNYILRKGEFEKTEYSDENILEVDKISILDEYGRKIIDNISFNVKKGEIFGIAGIAGNGQIELVEAIYKLRKIDKGDIRILGKSIRKYSEREIKRIIGYIPDKIPQAVILDMPLYENAILKNYDASEICRNKISIDYRKAYEITNDLIKEFNIAAENPNVNAGHLSGGNLQKLVLARELSINPKLIIAVNPTKTLDYMSTEAVYRILNKFRNMGKGILLVSEDTEEVLRLSDEVAVIYEGKIFLLGKRNEVDLDIMEDYMVRGEAKEKTPIIK